MDIVGEAAEQRHSPLEFRKMPGAGLSQSLSLALRYFTGRLRYSFIYAELSPTNANGAAAEDEFLSTL